MSFFNMIGWRDHRNKWDMWEISVDVIITTLTVVAISVAFMYIES